MVTENIDLDDACDEITMIADELKPKIDRMIELAKRARNSEGLLKKKTLQEALSRMFFDLKTVDEEASRVLQVINA